MGTPTALAVIQGDASCLVVLPAMSQKTERLVMEPFGRNLIGETDVVSAEVSVGDADVSSHVPGPLRRNI